MKLAMLDRIKEIGFIKRARRSPVYSRLRQYLPMPEPGCVDDRDQINDAEVVKIDWPAHVLKPTIGIVRDFEKYPRWTKYCRFLENNSFPYGLYDIHSHDWIEAGRPYDVVIGVVSSDSWHLDEIRRKYGLFETYMGKMCYPSVDHALLYEDKSLEAYVSSLVGIPFVRTYVSHDKEDALRIVRNLQYPVVSKIVPASGSLGVELVSSENAGRRIVNQAFSKVGRKSHLVHFRQKNYVYFQDFVPNSGYDIRVIVVDNWAFGYYRKVQTGDFRASGMNLVEKRGLPEEAVRLAWKVNAMIKSPMLAVDMLQGADEKYHVIEFSPICQMETPEQLHVDGVPGVYVLGDDGSVRFEKGRYWVHELALREFLLKDCLPKLLSRQ